MLLPLSLIFSLIHKQPWSVGSPSIHLLLHLQLISTLKIYWIISGGASLPSTGLLQEGSKATLWLSNQICAVPKECSEAECNCKTHYQYLYNGITCYSSSGSSIMQTKDLYHAEPWRRRGFIKYMATGTYYVFASLLYSIFFIPAGDIYEQCALQVSQRS